MTLDDYDQCASLEEVARLAAKIVEDAGTPWVGNFCLKAQFPVALLAQEGLPDVANKARLWQEVNCPKELHFSHGQYLGHGAIEHIAAELKKKSDSNRALASLISMKEIQESADDGALPSFLVFQCMIDGDTLYVTTIYRAMEVGTFFRINLEETRLMAKKVYEVNRTVTRVALCTFVTRAYIKEGMNPLERCEIDRLEQVKLMSDNRAEIPRLLREKSRHSTFPDATGLEALLSIARQENLPANMQIPGNGAALRAKLQMAIDDTVELKGLRKSASHHSDIGTIEARLRATLEKLADDIEKASKAAIT